MSASDAGVIYYSSLTVSIHMYTYIKEISGGFPHLMRLCCGSAVLWNMRGQPFTLQCTGTSTTSSPDTCMHEKHTTYIHDCSVPY
jgi:hypothetical protein